MKEEVRLLPLVQQVEIVREYVKQHYIKNDGALRIWGKIKSYAYHYSDKDYLLIDPDGEVLIK